MNTTDNFIVKKLSYDYANHLLTNSLNILASTEQKTTPPPLFLLYLSVKQNKSIKFRFESHHLLYIHLKIDSQIL